MRTTKRQRKVPEAVAVKRRQRQSSSEEAARERQDLRQGLAMGIRERRPDAASVVLAAGTAQAREEQRLHQKHKASPDTKTGQSAKTCLRREVPTDHEARSHTHAAGTAAEKESHDSHVRRAAAWKPNGSERKARSHPHSGSRRERTEDGWRRQRDEPEQPSSGDSAFYTRSAWRGRESGADHAQHVKKRAEENTWVSTWTGEPRVKRCLRAMECHGGRLMERHGDRKRRARESNVALQDLVLQET